MSKYKMRVVDYRDVEVLPEALVTLTEAADILGMAKTAVISLIVRDKLTEIIDTDEGYRGRRLLRAEVERLAESRARGEKDEGQSEGQE